MLIAAIKRKVLQERAKMSVLFFSSPLLHPGLSPNSVSSGVSLGSQVSPCCEALPLLVLSASAS